MTGNAIARVVEDEALDGAAASAFPILSDGNQDDVNDQFPDPDIDPETPEDATQPDSNSVTGNLGSLVVVGADSPGTWSIIGTDGLPTIYRRAAWLCTG